MRSAALAILFLIAAVLSSCRKESPPTLDTSPESDLQSVPEGFPVPEYPDDNRFSLDRWKLGKKLFFDPVMAVDYSISCASCHLPESAFSDTRAVSTGASGAPGTRNAPSLANVAYHPYFTREGGVPTLEMQVLVPIQEHNEFNFNILEISDRLRADEEYVDMSWKAYNREPDYYVITRALAVFERTLVSGNSAYDRFAFQGEEEALSEAEKRGMELFFSERTKCSSCHGGFNFTEYAFENNGLYEEYADPGRFRLTGELEDVGRFKVPSLRNIGYTAPYMHDGSVESLEEVLQHYNSGGSNHANKSPLIQPQNLSDNEKEDLLSFLLTLNDPGFTHNPLYRP
jgi:cytochrome c peroxidase